MASQSWTFILCVVNSFGVCVCVRTHCTFHDAENNLPYTIIKNCEINGNDVQKTERKWRTRRDSCMVECKNQDMALFLLFRLFLHSDFRGLSRIHITFVSMCVSVFVFVLALQQMCFSKNCHAVISVVIEMFPGFSKCNGFWCNDDAVWQPRGQRHYRRKFLRIVLAQYAHTHTHTQTYTQLLSWCKTHFVNAKREQVLHVNFRKDDDFGRALKICIC